ncbi:hypothetical protein [Natronobacterium gregoryi]|nr:hypothetical protein [Natronobacterium gregoryi]ELY69414.1 hypothetical protein C490_07819 [Natronobacterium gregoryi SP2]
MYGLEGGLVGWTTHVAHGAVLGVVFAAIVSTTNRDLTPRSTVAAGLAYGLAVWVALAVLVMPVWLSTVGVEMAPAFPNGDATNLMRHAVYGVGLEVVSVLLER